MPDFEDLRRDWRNRLERTQAATVVLAQTYAGRIESDMKADRPWQDRTGAARGNLFARAELLEQSADGSFVVGIRAGHGMQYGTWLELGTRFMKYGTVVESTGLIGYPIVEPTLRRYRPLVVEDLRRILGQQP